ncbi:MAG: LamG domain-containing protein [Anaerolineales bacterium]|nr:LamG domain-containing protein [Anaerolineales bacterium]
MRELKLNRIKATGTTVGDVYFPNVIFLAKFDGTNGSTSITDSSNKNHTITVNGGAQISTAASKFGGSSLKLDYENAGTGDRLVADTVADNLTSTTHTIEFWFKTDMADAHINSNSPAFFGFNDAGGGYANRIILQMTTKTNLRFYRESSAYHDMTVSALNDDAWHHIAIVSDGTDYDIYLDGSRLTTDAGDSRQINSDDTFIIGAELDSGPSTGNYFSGYIDDFRITNGVARYTGASFTLPTTHLTSAGDVNKHIVVNSGADGVAIGTGGINQARIAKAWVNFDGSGTVAIRGSYNVSSITDTNTGNYRVNFSTAMADTNYCALVTTDASGGQIACHQDSAGNYTTSVLGLRIYAGDTSWANEDTTTCTVLVFGN